MPGTPPIRVLDEETASRIAAGEVVERPASIVKELLENSLDAGATEIGVEVEAGGRRLIRVADNGRGIPSDQLELAFQRHSTSKIRKAEDLSRIGTLGFRGEALASIAAVCHVTIQTRAEGEETGTRLRHYAGRTDERASVGAPVGTAVTAENLFHAVPARLKFLRSETTEAGHIHDLVTRYAMAYPDRRFRLVRDGRTLFRSPGTGDRREALIAVFGADVARELLLLSAGLEGSEAARSGVAQVGVTGCVSPPHLHRASRKHITLFLNGRLIHDTSLSYAVMQAYHALLPARRYPVALVCIAVAPEVVDVNVHPAKTEIRLRDSRPVFAAIQQAVRAALGAGRFAAPFGAAMGDPTAVERYPASALRDRAGPRHIAETARQGSLPAPRLDRLPMLRVLGQLARAYIVAEGPDGMYLVDQHAAHERIVYERLRRQRGDVPSQPLLAPQPLSLTPAELAVLETERDAFAALGFVLEPFGLDAALVRSVPEGLETGDIAGLVASIIDTAMEGGDAIGAAFDERLTRAVCKQASVKAGQTLSLEEMRALIRDLEGTTSPRTCPHGRPTVVVLGHERLAREFGRR